MDHPIHWQQSISVCNVPNRNKRRRLLLIPRIDGRVGGRVNGSRNYPLLPTESNGVQRVAM